MAVSLWQLHLKEAAFKGMEVMQRVLA